MERNVCGFERVVRIVVGAVLLSVALFPRRIRGRDSITFGRVVAMYAGADLLLTGTVQWCPTNHLLGIDTCRESWLTNVRSLLQRVAPFCSAR